MARRLAHSRIRAPVSVCCAVQGACFAGRACLSYAQRHSARLTSRHVAMCSGSTRAGRLHTRHVSSKYGYFAICVRLIMHHSPSLLFFWAGFCGSTLGFLPLQACRAVFRPKNRRMGTLEPAMFLVYVLCHGANVFQFDRDALHHCSSGQLAMALSGIVGSLFSILSYAIPT